LLENFFKKGRELYAFELQKLIKELPIDQAQKLKKAISWLTETGRIERTSVALPIGDKGLILTEKIISKETVKVEEVVKKAIITG
jgi:hypothetical protein